MTTSAPPLTLSERARARWVWMRGQSILDESGCTALVQDVDESGPLIEDEDGLRHLTIAPVPDLTDELTRLALPAVVRKAWGSVHSVRYGKATDTYWWSGFFVAVYIDDGTARTFYGDTEVEAWIKALEAAP